MTSIGHMTPANSAPWGHLDHLTGSRTRISQVTARQTESKSITLNTAQGDTVTLAFSRTSELDYWSYQHLGASRVQAEGGDEPFGQWGQTYTSAERIAAGQASRLSISVEGDLSSEELEDIARAVRAVDRMMLGLPLGVHPDGDVGLVADLGLNSLSRVSATYGYTQSLQLNRLEVETQRASLQGIRPDDPLSWDRFARRLPGLVDPLMKEIGALRVEPRKLARPLETLFHGYQNRLDRADGRYPARHRMLEMIRQTFFERFTTLFADSLGPPASRSDDLGASAGMI